MSKLDWEGARKTRSKGGYLPFENFGTTYLNSFFPYMSKKWNNLPNSIQCLDLLEFKIQLKSLIKPSRIKHHDKGSKIGNCLLTRIRVGRSGLNLHKFTIGQIDKPECMCHFKEESPKHFFLDCFLYTIERQTLFSLVEHYIPKFQRLSNSEKFNILMNGLKPKNPDYDYLNMKITLALQLFIIKSKRFENHI